MAKTKLHSGSGVRQNHPDQIAKTVSFCLERAGEGIIGCPKHRDEDLGTVLVACRRVKNWDGVAGVIDLYYRTSLMAVAVPGTDPGLKLPVTRAEPTSASQNGRKSSETQR